MILSNNGVQVTNSGSALQLAQQIFIATFGANVNLDPSSPNGQTIQQIANAITTGDANLEYLLNSINPDLANGIELDAICANLYLYRKEASYSVVTCQVTGIANTIIPIGAQVQSTNGDIFSLITSKITIGSNGSGSGVFQANVVGSGVPVLANTITKILSSIQGWSSVNNNTAGITGSDIETDSQLRNRFKSAKALASSGSYQSVQSALLNIIGIGQFVLLENDTTATATISNVSVNANTLYLITNNSITSPLANNIAQTLFNYKSAGCGTQGSQVYQYPIPNTNPQQFIPIKWDIPTALTMTVTVTFTVGQVNTLKNTIANLINSNWNYQFLGQPVFATDFIKILGDNGITNIVKLQLSTDGGTTQNNVLTPAVNQIITTPLSANNIIIQVGINANI